MRQGPAAQPPRAANPSPRELAPIDLTGYWVSVVTEDWRYRMVMPLKGDYGSVPLNAAGRKAADAWTPDQAGRCEAFGAAAVMRAPGRIHITWEDDSTLKIETEAGSQTRRIRFGPSARRDGRFIVARRVGGEVGSSARRDRRAAYRRLRSSRRRAGRCRAPRGVDAAQSETTNLRAGWLRTNGVPYSAQTLVTEHFMRFAVPEAGEWLTVRTVVDDPTYLVQSFMTSTNFKREADGSKWSPKPCREESPR